MSNQTFIEDELEAFADELKSRGKAEVVLTAIAWGTFSTFAVIGNLITMVVVYKNRSLWCPTNMFIASLALSDFGFGVFNCVPLGLSTLAMSRFPFSWFTCQYQGYVCIVMISCSIQTLGWAAVNRYYKVVKTAAKYAAYFSKRNTKRIILLTWILSFFAPVFYFADGSVFVFQPGKAFCYFRLDCGVSPVIATWLYIGIPAAAICYCYTAVFVKVRHHNTQMTQSSHVHADEIKVTKTLFVIVLAFISCWTPILVVDSIDYLSGHWSMPRYVYLTCSFLSIISSTLNPGIYVALNPTFRKKYKLLFQRRNVIENSSVTN